MLYAHCNHLRLARHWPSHLQAKLQLYDSTPGIASNFTIFRHGGRAQFHDLGGFRHGGRAPNFTIFGRFQILTITDQLPTELPTKLLINEHLLLALMYNNAQLACNYRPITDNYWANSGRWGLRFPETLRFSEFSEAVLGRLKIKRKRFWTV